MQNKDKNQKGNIGVVVSFIIVVGLIGLAIYFLMNKPVKENPLEGIKNGQISEKPQEGAPEGQANQEQPAQQELSNNQKENMNPNAKILGSFTPVSKVPNLEKIDLIIGTGKEVKAGDTVSVHYTGAVAATGAIFQSSKDFGTEPVTFPLANVIKGWTDGIPGMKIGGTRRLVIPAEMAYGANPPASSGIPANADLVFDVELIAIK